MAKQYQCMYFCTLIIVFCLQRLHSKENALHKKTFKTQEGQEYQKNE